MQAKANYVPIDQLPSYVGKKARPLLSSLMSAPIFADVRSYPR